MLIQSFSCRDVTGRASLIVDGELPRNERLGVRVHLLVCSHCRRFLKNLRGLVQAMRLRNAQREAVPVDDAFSQRLVTAMVQAVPATRPDEPPS